MNKYEIEAERKALEPPIPSTKLPGWPMGSWERWYAWKPVKLHSGRTVWREWVWRQHRGANSIAGGWSITVYQTDDEHTAFIAQVYNETGA